MWIFRWQKRMLYARIVFIYDCSHSWNALLNESKIVQTTNENGLLIDDDGDEQAYLNLLSKWIVILCRFARFCHWFFVWRRQSDCCICARKIDNNRNETKKLPNMKMCWLLLVRPVSVVIELEWLVCERACIEVCKKEKKTKTNHKTGIYFVACEWWRVVIEIM